MPNKAQARKRVVKMWGVFDRAGELVSNIVRQRSLFKDSLYLSGWKVKAVMVTLPPSKKRSARG